MHNSFTKRLVRHLFAIARKILGVIRHGSQVCAQGFTMVQGCSNDQRPSTVYTRTSHEARGLCRRVATCVGVSDRCVFVKRLS